MGSMAKNDYHDIAQMILAEQAAGGGDDENAEAMPDNEGAEAGSGAFDIRKFANDRSKAWNADETGSEVGFDSETLQMLLQQLGGPEGVAALSAGDVSNALLREAPDDDTSAAYDALPPDQKIKLLESIINSDGLGDMKGTLDYMMQNQNQKQDFNNQRYE